MFKLRRWFAYLLILLVLTLPGQLFAAGEHGIRPETWLYMAAILVAAKLGGELSVRLKQPAVLGELLAGIVLGNLHLAGITLFSQVPQLPAIEFAAELGVVLLLFEVGLESTVQQMRKVAPLAGMVAVIGVVAPMLLGSVASALIMPESDTTLHLFVGATLCATSVGITARVLQDLKATARGETRVIIGAAVIDDVLGLIVLAVVSAVAVRGTVPPAPELAGLIGLAFGFLVGALLLGTFVTPGVYRRASTLRAPGVLGALSIALCLLLAGISAISGLAAIVGAFAAGLILDDVHVRPFGDDSMHRLEEYVRPIVGFFAPIFFVRTGMQVNLDGITLQTLILACVLLLVGVAGKMISGLGVRGKDVDRLTVGIGMVPRGEVGLIFADAGARIVNNGVPLISPAVYAALVLMVMITTVVTPPALSYRLKKVMGQQAQLPKGRAPDSEPAPTVST